MFQVNAVGGNFAGGRKELARRLLNNPEEEQPKIFEDEAVEDDDDFDLLINSDQFRSANLNNHRVANMPQQSGLFEDSPNPVTNSATTTTTTTTTKKGILWQQRDKIFARWKERFFVLTKDYLQCFKKGTSRLTEMGGFIYGIRLTEVRKNKNDLQCIL